MGGGFGGGAQPGGFLFIGQGDADDTSYHQWYRTLHTPNGDAVITAAVNSDAYEKDEKNVSENARQLQTGLRLAEAGAEQMLEFLEVGVFGKIKKTAFQAAVRHVASR